MSTKDGSFSYGDKDGVAHTGLVCCMVDEHGQRIPTPPAAPIEEGGIVFDPGQLLDSSGRGLTVMEMMQHNAKQENAA